jgi:hypothetical protein
MPHSHGKASIIAGEEMTFICHYLLFCFTAITLGKGDTGWRERECV